MSRGKLGSGRGHGQCSGQDGAWGVPEASRRPECEQGSGAGDEGGREKGLCSQPKPWGVRVRFVFSKVTLAAERSVVGENWSGGSRGDQLEGTVAWTRDTQRSWQLGKAQDMLWRWEPLASLKDKLQPLLCGTSGAFLEALGQAHPPTPCPGVAGASRREERWWAGDPDRGPRGVSWVPASLGAPCLASSPPHPPSPDTTRESQNAWERGTGDPSRGLVKSQK